MPGISTPGGAGGMQVVVIGMGGSNGLTLSALGHASQRRSLACATLGILFVLASARIAGATVGYTPRPCGFDLNHDGTIGGAGDCNICNGIDTFPDKTLLYVDCQNGNDSSGNGAPTNPFKTIQKALNTANGPSDGKADVVCFKGTCHEALTPKQSGPSGTYVRDGFTFPTKPAMIVGWDANHNGSYPPYDTADVAVLDGTGLALAIDNNGPVSNFELAHFTAKSYGATQMTGWTGFMHGGRSQFTGSNIYVHDLSLQDINRGRVRISDTIVFNFFQGSAHLSNFAIVNIEVRDFGGYFTRGAAIANPDSGPYRFQNITMTGHGANNDSVAGFKLWGYMTGIQVLDNYFDVNVAAWTPQSNGGPPTYAITPAQCTQNWTIRGNTFVDWKNVLGVQPWAGTDFCYTRAVDNVVFDGNVIRNTYAPWIYGDDPIEIDPGNDLNTTVNNITISNNFIWSSTGFQTCIMSNAGNNAGVQGGTIKILNNTCVTDINRWAAIVIGNADNTGMPTYKQQNYIIKDNVIAGLTSGDVNVNTQYQPSNLQMDGNVYDPNGGFSWNNSCAQCVTARDLATWRTQSHQDVNSRACSPTFANKANGDLHLAANDSCARDHGVNASLNPNIDIDGNPRPMGSAYDCGADEASGLSAPQLIDVTALP